MNKKLFKDFCTFSKYQLGSWDIDPTYPVLKEYYTLNEYSIEESLWFTLLYVTFYHLGSAQTVFDKYPVPAKVGNLTYPTGIERRGFRGNTLASIHLNAVVEKIKTVGDIHSWIMSIKIDKKPRTSWKRLREEFETLPYAGPWSSYKWVDLLKNVHNYRIASGR